MGSRSHSQNKTSQQPTSAPSQNLARSRPFAIQAQPEANNTQQQEAPDLQTQLETAQRFGHSFSKISVSTPAIIQPKLTIGAPGDKYEQEADRVAQQVVQDLNAPNVGRSQSAHSVQREALPEEDEIHMNPLMGNQAVVERLSAHRIQNTIQRSFTTLPVEFVGDDPVTAHTKFTKYVGSEPIATDGNTFSTEYQRILTALLDIQPTKAKKLAEKLKTIGMEKNKSTAIANAAKLEVFVNYVNGLAATYQLDAAPAAITARVDDDGSHHMDYFFKLPGDDAEKKFDLDEWSRKGTDFLKGQSSGLTIKGIIQEAVKDWDTDKGSIVSLLVARLLGTSELGGTATPMTVKALFMNSPVGPNYTKILMAAENIIGVRTADLKPRGVKVQHWIKTKPTEKDNAQDQSIDWPALLKKARAAFRKHMIDNEAAAVQPTARNMAVAAISDNEAVEKLSRLDVLTIDSTDGTFALNNKVQRNGINIYQAMPDERFNFDINHFTAILFFEWKAVTDLTR